MAGHASFNSMNRFSGLPLVLVCLGFASSGMADGIADPLSAEYPRMATLLDQLELAALKADRASSKETPARANGAVDDSRRYRDNVAEYYRKLGETNDR